METPWSTVGYLCYKRTYARDTGLGRTEEWNETIDRVLQAAQDIGVGFTPEENQRLQEYMLTLKGTVAGRFLWQMGTPTVDKLGLASLMNCAFVVVDSPIRPFTWTFDNLMLGSGVGYNIQRENVYKLPPVSEEFQEPGRQDNASADFIVPDTREGWVALLERTLEHAFGFRTGTFTYSTQLIRGKGAPIKGFGGTASGPEDLVRGITQISGVVAKRRGKQLRPIDCLDIMNIIGSVVVAGNVRRSAQIAIGDPDDLQFLKAKNWAEGVPNWRAMSNNSVVCNNIKELPEEFWKTYENGGEPYGLINLKLSQSCGRIGDTQYKDKLVRGFNPCAEQPLANHEVCCLAEVFLPNVESKEELLDLCTLLYRVNKHALMLPCHNIETQDIVRRHMRMGIGVTGYLQCSEEQRSWLPEVYEQLRAFDVRYSTEHGMPVSIKLTTTKPSGTLSLLPGVTPGVHPGYAQYMIRRIRVASDSPMLDVCRNHGYPVEPQVHFDGTPDHSTYVVEFPFSYPQGTVLAKDLTAIQQLEWVERLQREWSDNAVSCTVYYKKEELPEIRAYLGKRYNKTFKSLSFLLHEDHGFAQAPFEEISAEEYALRMAECQVITSVDTASYESDDECSKGACPLR